MEVDDEAQELIVWLKEKPVEGKATIAMLKLLKRIFWNAILISGATSRTKVVEIPQNSFDEIVELLDHI